MRTQEKTASIYLKAGERTELEQQAIFILDEFDGEKIYQPHKLQARVATYALWLLDHRWGIETIVDDLAMLTLSDEARSVAGETIANLIRYFNLVNKELLIHRR
jgi:hypothetical protein